MSSSNACRWLGFASVVLLATPAHAGLADFVSPSDCEALSRPCVCDDLPMMDLFVHDQQKALEAWRATKDAILTPGGPLTQAEAIDDFHSRFEGDQRIVDQFESCPDFDPKVNDPRKIAGVAAGRGGAALDACFCKTFCVGIVDATAAHERTHFAFGLVAVTELIGVSAACTAGLFDDGFCASLQPQLLADSELAAHTVGINALNDSIKALDTTDPDTLQMACSWEPLPPPAPQPSPVPAPPPASFWQRVELLTSRFVHGASPANPSRQ